jgi:hypothetical protein
MSRAPEDSRYDLGMVKLRDLDRKLFPESKLPVLDEARDALDPTWWCSLCKSYGKATWARRHTKQHTGEKRTLVNRLKRDSAGAICQQAEQTAWIQHKRARGTQSSLV